MTETTKQLSVKLRLVNFAEITFEGSDMRETDERLKELDEYLRKLFKCEEVEVCTIAPKDEPIVCKLEGDRDPAHIIFANMGFKQCPDCGLFLKGVENV